MQTIRSVRDVSASGEAGLRGRLVPVMREKNSYLLWQSSTLLLSEWQSFSKYECKKKENQTLRGCSLFFSGSKVTENARII